MPVFLLSLLGFGRSALKAALAWLSHRSFWQLAFGAVAIFALIQHFELGHVRKEAVNYSRQRDAYKAQFDAISTRKNEQKIVTRDRIVTVIKTLKGADQRAKAVEAAPLPGECKSPPEIMGADL